jgi:hypothetical protein
MDSKIRVAVAQCTMAKMLTLFGTMTTQQTSIAIANAVVVPTPSLRLQTGLTYITKATLTIYKTNRQNRYNRLFHAIAATLVYPLTLCNLQSKQYNKFLL